jgi:endonuclease/exonuclease/phosphatase family metal-dependent hydrolase
MQNKRFEATVVRPTWLNAVREMTRRGAVALLLLGACPSTQAQSTATTRPATAPSASNVITVATYNIEHFQNRFLAHELGKKMTREQKADPNVALLLEQLRFANDEDNWEISQVITDSAVNPDVLVIQEGCTQDNLEYFNKRWLRGAYETVIQFPSNTGDRNQHLNMLLKPGFKVLKRMDQYHQENDTVQNGRGEKLFARGPAFALVQSPSGYKFWVGVTHQKSKRNDFDAEKVAELRKSMSGQPKAVIDEKIDAEKKAAALSATQWRNREAARTHAIMKELAAGGESDDVVLLGDMNDELGKDEVEQAAGADAIELLVGPKQDGFVLVTQPLAERKEISFGGYSRPDNRSFIDHVVATPAMAEQFTGVRVYRAGVARVASDHYPVVVKFTPDAAKP